jgi:hypothetical protein
MLRGIDFIWINFGYHRQLALRAKTMIGNLGQVLSLGGTANFPGF